MVFVINIADMKARSLFSLFVLLLVRAGLHGAEPGAEFFPISYVELLESHFQRAERLNTEYILALDPDRLLAPFLRESGLEPKAESYGNWENTGLDGHIGGHYLSALSRTYASTGDERIGRRLEYMLSELGRVQTANGNGYIGGVPGGGELWKQIAHGDIRAGGFELNGKWVPLYNIHKTFAGLRDVWVHTGNRQALNMLIAMTEWMAGVTENLTDSQIQDMLVSEHGGLNEIFADVAAVTGEEKYLRLAERFSHRTILDPLLYGVDELTGKHANTQIPKVLGYKRIADLRGNEQWHAACRFFWHTVVQNRSVSIGGNSVREHFHPADDFSQMISSEEGPETCNTYNMLRLTEMLFSTEPSSHYMDYYEKGLFNHILSTQNPNNGGLVYFTPMCPGHYRVYSQPHTSMWCCVGSGIENHSKYGSAIYARTGDDIWVNLFIPSRLRWEEKGLELVQSNGFPEESATHITVYPSAPSRFGIRVRYPGWSKSMDIKVNGNPVPVSRGADGYVTINRLWENGDRIDILFGMDLKVEGLPDTSPYRSISYGPVVLAARWNDSDMIGLLADDSRGGHIARGPHIPSYEIPVLPEEDQQILSSIRPTGIPLHFELFADGRTFTLEPFYGIHESRYIIYWPVSPYGINAGREESDRATVDVVYCGQQQPESDHGFRSEGSEAGYSDSYHWRRAEGWFSYRMDNIGGQAGTLRITYLPPEQGKVFTLEINGSAVHLPEEVCRDDHPCITDIMLPNGSESIEVKIIGRPATPRITEIRLIR